MSVIITMVNIGAIDLNLLLVLHVVPEEQSATRAARRLHVTQSAVSNALARLRELLQDPLLVRHARGLAPTPHANALRPQLARLVQDASAVFEPPVSFAPHKSTREFRIAGADYCGVTLLPRIFELLQARAPLATLQLLPIEQLMNGGLARDIDVHIGMPPSVPKGAHSLALFEDEFVCLTRSAHGAAPRPRMSLKEYMAHTHVRVSVLNTTSDPIDQLLSERGAARRIALTVPHFSVLPHVVAQTGAVATISRQLALSFAADARLAIRTAPLAMHTRALQMIWHSRSDADEGGKFLRALVKDAADSLRNAANK
jgi:DNA-binding transcriptional LysR family regulator